MAASIEARRSRDAAFEAELFGEPAWDMMLELLLARLERRPVSVSKLSLLAGVPQTTALRWIATLGAQGILERTPDPCNGRRIIVSLTDSSAGRLTRLLEPMRTRGLFAL